MRTQADLFFLAQTLNSRRVSLFKDPDSRGLCLQPPLSVKNGKSWLNIHPVTQAGSPLRNREKVGHIMPDESQTFWGQINARNAAQLLSFAANFGQVSGIAVQIVMGIISQFSESDTQLILDAINQLQVQLQTDFFQLANLIVQQAKIIEQTIDRDAMATALSHTDAAISEMNTFLQTRNPTDLSLANDESAVGLVSFSTRVKPLRISSLCQVWSRPAP